MLVVRLQHDLFPAALAPSPPALLVGVAAVVPASMFAVFAEADQQGR
jgi:hypothetical protein